MINRLRDTYTQVDNRFLNKSHVSLKAKWLYAFMCSKPDNWKFSIYWLTTQLKEWEKSIREWIKEIEWEGYLLKSPIKWENNNFCWWEWIINPSEEDLKNSQNRKCLKQEVPILGSSKNRQDISNNKYSNTKSSNNIYILSFQEFWEKYPKHTNKKETLVEWERATHKDTPENIIKWLDNYLVCKKVKEWYIKEPHRWLKHELWNDVYEEEKPTKKEEVKHVDIPEEIKWKDSLVTSFLYDKMTYDKEKKVYLSKDWEEHVVYSENWNYIFLPKHLHNKYFNS